jgi:hypothetical protein
MEHPTAPPFPTLSAHQRPSHHPATDPVRHRPGPAPGLAAPSACGSPAWSVNRYKCKEIGSYARAQELLREEGHTYLDRNGDGIACKSLRKG